MITTSYGKLYNTSGELIAEGACQVDDQRGSVTLRPPYDMPLLERQHGILRLELEDGGEYTLSDRVLKFRMNLPGAPPGNVYRLTFSGQQRLSSWPAPPSRPLEFDERWRPPERRGPDDIPPELRR